MIDKSDIEITEAFPGTKATLRLDVYSTNGPSAYRERAFEELQERLYGEAVGELSLAFKVASDELGPDSEVCGLIMRSVSMMTKLTEKDKR